MDFKKLFGEPLSQFNRPNGNWRFDVLVDTKGFSELFPEFEKIYFVGDCSYSEESQNRIKAVSDAESIKSVVTDFEWDKSLNNINIFYVEKNASEFYLITVTDYYDPFIPDKIMDVIPFAAIDLMLIDHQLIFTRV